MCIRDRCWKIGFAFRSKRPKMMLASNLNSSPPRFVQRIFAEHVFLWILLQSTSSRRLRRDGAIRRLSRQRIVPGDGNKASRKTKNRYGKPNICSFEGWLHHRIGGYRQLFLHDPRPKISLVWRRPLRLNRLAGRIRNRRQISGNPRFFLNTGRLDYIHDYIIIASTSSLWGVWQRVCNLHPETTLICLTWKTCLNRSSLKGGCTFGFIPEFVVGET